MARLSINEMTTYRWSFEDDVAHYAAAGIAGIGVWRQKLSDFGEERGIELLRDSGLEVSNLMWAGGFTGGDGRSLRESVDDCLEAVALAADLRAGCLVLYSGARAGHTHAHARRIVRDALRDALSVACERKVTLALEPMHADCACDWTFLTSLDEALDFLDFVDSPWLKVVVDTYHFGLGPRTVRRLEEVAPRVAIVHLGDGKPPIDREQNRCSLGDGIVPLKELVDALAAGGYDGYYDVELLGPDVENTDYHGLIERSKQVFGRLFTCQSTR